MKRFGIEGTLSILGGCRESIGRNCGLDTALNKIDMQCNASATTFGILDDISYLPIQPWRMALLFGFALDELIKVLGVKVCRESFQVASRSHEQSQGLYASGPSRRES